MTGIQGSGAVLTCLRRYRRRAAPGIRRGAECSALPADCGGGGGGGGGGCKAKQPLTGALAALGAHTGLMGRCRPSPARHCLHRFGLHLPSKGDCVSAPPAVMSGLSVRQAAARGGPSEGKEGASWRGWTQWTGRRRLLHPLAASTRQLAAGARRKNSRDER